MSDVSNLDATLFEFGPSLRRRLESAIHSLVALLDEIDGDADFEEEPDLEDGFDSEQELGATNALNQQRAWSRGNQQNLDGNLEFEGEMVPECDGEPSLGSIGSTNLLQSQEDWAAGAVDECEDEHDGSEPDEDGEPSLGWGGVGHGHPEPATFLGTDLEQDIGPDDREWDPAESGIADYDGIAEQGFTGYGAVIA